MAIVVRYMNFYFNINEFIKTTLWQGVKTQMYAEQLSSGSYRTFSQQPLALALDGDIYD